MIIKEQDLKIQHYFEDIFNEIQESTSDYDTLIIAIEILKIFRDRLDSDLNDKSILYEYKVVNHIIDMLLTIKEFYV